MNADYIQGVECVTFTSRTFSGTQARTGAPGSEIPIHRTQCEAHPSGSGSVCITAAAPSLSTPTTTITGKSDLVVPAELNKCNVLF